METMDHFRSVDDVIVALLTVVRIFKLLTTVGVAVVSVNCVYRRLIRASSASMCTCMLEA